MIQKTKIENDVWIKGYIVGSYSTEKKSTFTNSEVTTKRFLLALAYSKEEKDYEKTFLIKLETGKCADSFTLIGHPEYFKREICLQGDIQRENYATDKFHFYATKGVIDDVLQ